MNRQTRDHPSLSEPIAAMTSGMTVPRAPSYASPRLCGGRMGGGPRGVQMIDGNTATPDFNSSSPTLPTQTPLPASPRRAEERCKKENRLARHARVHGMTLVEFLLALAVV